MAETKQLAHTAEEIDQILETDKQHCANADAHTCKEDKARWDAAATAAEQLETDISLLKEKVEKLENLPLAEDGEF